MIATLLSAAGLYGVIAYGVAGVIAYGVAHRTSEIGVPMALGARRSHIAWLFLRPHARADLHRTRARRRVCGRPADSITPGRDKPADPFTLTAVVLLLVVVAMAACFIPTRRAARLDPIAALRPSEVRTQPAA